MSRLSNVIDLRDRANRFIVDSLTRRRITLASDGAGGQTESVATLAFSGVITTDAWPTEFQTADRQEGQTGAALWVAVNTDLTVKDEIDDGAGNRYEIVSAPVRSTVDAMEKFELAYIGDNV